jgi:hypothetical protein
MLECDQRETNDSAGMLTSGELLARNQRRPASMSARSEVRLGKARQKRRSFRDDDNAGPDEDTRLLYRESFRIADCDVPEAADGPSIRIPRAECFDVRQREFNYHVSPRN